ncbi:hypothetical protein GW7_07662 [Heterocephalus glaber]|uniref:Uncharacterized protein n=1 Tax=Heterocephalus glaber TaxID=10181 RepID=G5BMX9_HETGA|nr:hypothetical protein GW7_07662 [Heterocephalus glaber]
MVSLLFLRQAPPEQGTCNKITSTRETHRYCNSPSPDRVPNVAAGVSQALPPPRPEGRKRRGSFDATNRRELPRRRHLSIT